ncbi:MAG: anthranilate synthase component I [Porcipelethomonas sp.]
MIYPSADEIRKKAGQFKIHPVFMEIRPDSFTPVHIFKALKRGEENAFMLESVSNENQWDRYSFIGINPKMEIRIDKGIAEVTKKNNKTRSEISSPVDFIENIMKDYTSPKIEGMPKFTGGFVGYFGYDTVRYTEKKLVNVPEDDTKMPDCHLFLYDELVAYDHLQSKVVIILNIDLDGDIDAQYKAAEERFAKIEDKINSYFERPHSTGKYTDYEVKSNVTKEEFINNVNIAKKHIVDGDIFQIVLSQRFEIDNPPDSFNVYRMLRATNPSPYLYYFTSRDYQIAGASPEMLVSVMNGIVKTKPIAGTVPRGKTPKEDAVLEKKLNADPKERAEHTMLVDLGRNDVGKVSKFGTVEVESFMKTEKYSKVMHLVSDVKGELRDDKTALDALMAVLPAGTLSGAPKVRAMELIDELENKRRGLYGGTVGYIGFDGNIDTCIAIRTVLFKNSKAYVQAGAGIVHDSIPEKEYEETRNKSLAMINAIREASKL